MTPDEKGRSLSSHPARISVLVIRPHIKAWAACKNTIATIEFATISETPCTGALKKERPTMSAHIRIIRQKIQIDAAPLTNPVSADVALTKAFVLRRNEGDDNIIGSFTLG